MGGVSSCRAFDHSYDTFDPHLERGIGRLRKAPRVYLPNCVQCRLVLVLPVLVVLVARLLLLRGRASDLARDGVPDVIESAEEEIVADGDAIHFCASLQRAINKE